MAGIKIRHRQAFVPDVVIAEQLRYDLGFVGTNHHHDNASGGINELERGSHAVSAEYRNEPDHHELIGIVGGALPGKQAGCMPIATHPEHYQIEARHTRIVSGHAVADELFVIRSRRSQIVRIGRHRVYIFRPDWNMIEQGSLGHVVIAFDIILRNVAFITEEHIHVLPRNIAIANPITQMLVQSVRCGSPGESYVARASLFHGLADGASKEVRHVLHSTQGRSFYSNALCIC